MNLILMTDENSCFIPPLNSVDVTSKAQRNAESRSEYCESSYNQFLAP